MTTRKIPDEKNSNSTPTLKIRKKIQFKDIAKNRFKTLCFTLKRLDKVLKPNPNYSQLRKEHTIYETKQNPVQIIN